MAEPFAVRIARYMLILAAILASPIYALWLAGGAIADRIGQRRNINAVQVKLGNSVA